MIDKIDKKILRVLQTDGRMPNKEIAEKVGLVPSAISERLKKLRKKGIIKSFQTQLDATQLNKNLLAFIFVKTNEMVKKFNTGKKLAAIEEVMEVHNIAGEDCYLVKARIKDAATLSNFLQEKIGTIESVVSTRTTIVMESYKESLNYTID